MSYSIPLKLCDWTLQLGWYRFREAAGNMMPTSCVPMNKCGTHATGWLQGRHPSPWEGAIQATVCFDWTFECCMWSSKIRVRNCGSFYVYELGPTPLCNLRYCGNGAQGTYMIICIRFIATNISHKKDKQTRRKHNVIVSKTLLK